jgi:hypothetical protein
MLFGNRHPAPEPLDRHLAIASQMVHFYFFTKAGQFNTTVMGGDVFC